MHKFLFRYLGNLLILLSFAGFISIAYPIVRIYIFPPETVPVRQLKGLHITIPKIHAQAKIITNVDPWNETEYDLALKKGIAHAKGTALPGEKGTVYLFAHSSGAPWDLSWYNTIFLRLGELEKGDLIIVMNDGKKYDYIVQEKKIVLPDEVNYLLQTGKDQLILQTCTPIGTSFKRLLVFARLS